MTILGLEWRSNEKNENAKEKRNEETNKWYTCIYYVDLWSKWLCSLTNKGKFAVIDGLICPKTTELYCPNLAEIYVRQNYGILSV